jgi:pimeloyl-ACP methyl ester carboxylesterase
MRRHDDKLDEAQARRFAELGTRKVEGGYAWKQDPLHLTAGPHAFRLDVATRYWQRVTCPVLIVDGADSQFRMPPEDRAKRRALFVNHRHVVVDHAGHAIARHQPARVAELLLELIA